jgi:hypothetical protein
MELPKKTKDVMMIALVAVILLIHAGVYLTFKNTFWLGLAGVFSVPFLFGAFLVDIYVPDHE